MLPVEDVDLGPYFLHALITGQRLAGFQPNYLHVLPKPGKSALKPSLPMSSFGYNRPVNEAAQGALVRLVVVTG